MMTWTKCIPTSVAVTSRANSMARGAEVPNSRAGALTRLGLGS